jgi:hypothetical protein
MALVLAAAAWQPAAAAEAPTAQAPAPAEKGTFSLVVENDLFADFDRHYTNGIELSWTSGPDAVPDWLLDAAHAFPLFPDAGRVRVTYSAGQSIYTPSDITQRSPRPDDRPYAGWLHASVGLTAETGSRLDQLQLTVGMVGPAALAGQTQKFVHEITGADRPRGWSHQLENEPGIVLSYDRSWRALASGSLLGFSMDFTPHVGGALGNVFTFADAGAMVRLGYDLPNDYGPPRIQPGLPGSGFFEPGGDFGWYLFAGIDGRAVARNIFLDGNTFVDSRSVDKEPLVGDAQAGIAFTFGNTRVAYTHVFRTREFDCQGDFDEFGALSISARF